MHKLPCSLLTASIIALSFIHVAAAEQTGRVTIEQVPLNAIVGDWILIKPGNKRVSLHKESYALENAPLGNYTLLIEPPVGASATIQTFLGSDLLSEVERQQTSFTLEQNMDMRIHIEYTFTRVGMVSVGSTPPGLSFTLTGPNSVVLTGKTPSSFPESAEGLYTVRFDPLEDCATPKPQSDRLQKDSRINFSITITCEGIERLIETQQYQRTIEFVTTVIDGETVVFDDVLVAEWFAPYVFTALKTGIMSGYRDDAGKPTGKFGPGDHVTVAQLAKIAHELAGIDEGEVHTPPKNPRAQNSWFTQYLASAEHRDWLVYWDARIDPLRPATRAEVIATLLQALGIPSLWPTGEMFSDVGRRTTYASSIETAASDGIIGGFTDFSGNPTGEFGPNQPVNRAEVAKMISKIIKVYLGGE